MCILLTYASTVKSKFKKKKSLICRNFVHSSVLVSTIFQVSYYTGICFMTDVVLLAVCIICYKNKLLALVEIADIAKTSALLAKEKANYCYLRPQSIPSEGLG